MREKDSPPIVYLCIAIHNKLKKRFQKPTLGLSLLRS